MKAKLANWPSNVRTLVSASETYETKMDNILPSIFDKMPCHYFSRHHSTDVQYCTMPYCQQRILSSAWLNLYLIFLSLVSSRTLSRAFLLPRWQRRNHFCFLALFLLTRYITANIASIAQSPTFTTPTNQPWQKGSRRTLQSTNAKREKPTRGQRCYTS